MNKKAQSFAIFTVICVSVIFIIGLGFIMFASNEVNKGLMSVDEMVGQVNFTESVENTWGKFNDGLFQSANLMGIMVLFGLFIGLLLNAYFNRNKRPALFFIVDIFIIFAAFIVSGYVADSYEILLGITEFEEVFVENLNLVAKMMLNLPIIVLIFGVLTMIISYSGLPAQREEQVAGF